MPTPLTDQLTWKKRKHACELEMDTFKKRDAAEHARMVKRWKELRIVLPKYQWLTKGFSIVYPIQNILNPDVMHYELYDRETGEIYRFDTLKEAKEQAQHLLTKTP